MRFISNAFSLNMVAAEKATIKVVELPLRDFRHEVTELTFATGSLPRGGRRHAEQHITGRRLKVVSAIGHADTAAILGGFLGCEVPANRISVSLKPGDTLYVAQYSGPRLPEGTTELPEGAGLRYLMVSVAVPEPAPEPSPKLDLESNDLYQALVKGDNSKAQKICEALFMDDWTAEQIFGRNIWA